MFSTWILILGTLGYPRMRIQIRPVRTAEPPRRFRGSHSNRRQPVPSEKLPKTARNKLQMTITRPTPGLRSSSFAHPIQVDHPGAHGTIPDRFRAIPDDFLMKRRQKCQKNVEITKNGPENYIFCQKCRRNVTFFAKRGQRPFLSYIKK